MSVFKVAKTKPKSAKKELEVVLPPEPVAKLVDIFTEKKAELDFLEGELKAVSNNLLDFAKKTFAERMISGKKGNFKIKGEENQVLFLSTPGTSGFAEDDIEEFGRAHGPKAKKGLLELDVKSIKFNSALFLEHREKIENALVAALGAELVGQLFVGTSMKTIPTIIDDALGFAKTSEQLQSLYKDLKIKQYFKVEAKSKDEEL